MKCFTFWENSKTIINSRYIENYRFILNTCHGTAKREETRVRFPVIFSCFRWPIEPKFSQNCYFIYKLWFTKCGPLDNTVYWNCPMALKGTSMRNIWRGTIGNDQGWTPFSWASDLKHSSWSKWFLSSFCLSSPIQLTILEARTTSARSTGANSSSLRRTASWSATWDPTWAAVTDIPKTDPSILIIRWSCSWIWRGGSRQRLLWRPEEDCEILMGEDKGVYNIG